MKTIQRYCWVVFAKEIQEHDASMKLATRTKTAPKEETLLLLRIDDDDTIDANPSHTGIVYAYDPIRY
jgi:hypothetical protein